jgi:hypothetical protein
MIKVNKALVDSYFKNAKRHNFYKKSETIYQHLSFHIDGYEYEEGVNENPFFDKLIGERRPNEGAEILAYRKKIYLNKTTQPCFKVINSLKKIVKSQDWKVDYSAAETPPLIKDESLFMYCELDYPIFNSIENWIFTYGLQYILTDPNSLVYVEPITWDIPNNEKWKPVAKFVESKMIFDYKHGEYAVFQTDRTAPVVVDGHTHYKPVNMIITGEAIYELIPLDLKNNFRIDVKWQHNSGNMFAFKSGGLYKQYSDGNPLYNSFLNPMVSGLDAVAREVSDLDAEVVQHIYSTMWYVAGNDCKTCMGTGTTMGNASAGFGMASKGQKMTCQVCQGNGRMLKSPYKDIVISKKAGENTPTPPAGYIQKDTAIVKLQDDRIANHTFDALSALNMEFLAQTPLNQSGKAKEVDKDELNNYVYSVAYHLVRNVMLPVYKMIAQMRYSEIIKSEDLLKKMIPQITVPEKYDLLSSNNLVEGYKNIKESNLDMNIVNEIENDIINKIFSNEPDTRLKLLLIKSLDPLRGLSIEDKSSMLLTATIKKEDLVISNYITEFVTEALIEDEKFATLPLKDQQTIIAAKGKAKGLDVIEGLENDLIGGDSAQKAAEDVKLAIEDEKVKAGKKGVYIDSKKNRDLNRVGKEYGTK